MRRARRKKRLLYETIKWLLLSIFLAIFYFPVYWLLTTSFKMPTEWLAWPPVFFPATFTLDNYKIALDPTGEVFGFLAREVITAGVIEQSVVPMMVNSLIIAGGATIVAVIVGYCAAYAISRYGTGGSFLYFFLLLTRMSPPIAFVIPLLIFFRFFGMLDSHLTLLTIYAGFTTVYGVWMLKSFIDEIPREIEEAAIMDGIPEAQIPFKVTLPLVKGGLLAASLFIFILNWSEALIALIFTCRVAVTVPVHLTKYSTAYGMMYGPIAAVSILAVIPMLALGYMVQKSLVRGFTFGAVRGA